VLRIDAYPLIMSNPRYPEEFKIQAVNRVAEKQFPVADVAARLGKV
jgi:transposase